MTVQCVQHQTIGEPKNVGEFCEVCRSYVSKSRNGAKLRDEELIFKRNLVASQENIVEMRQHVRERF